ncbi:toxin-antitoxin system YwqK family antitoxin [Marivirga sp.]|uniref:toxin-antitoxin system YwqK family antitoxin n=1 Tax=Marivirga sp. TaxID=2018662 RepID=UPI003DA79259
MTREDQLQFCKKCINRKMDMQQGLICSLTNEKANFKDNCEDFQIDESVKEEIPVVNRSATELIAELPEDIKNEFIPHQDLQYAVLGGFFVSVICALIWAAITVTTEYQIAYMAIGVGFLVGLGVRFFGAGITPIFGYVGGFFALLGCLLGNFFSQVGFIADAQTMGYFQTLTLIDFETIILITQEAFTIIDLVFYGVAMFAGYKFSFRSIPANTVEMTDFTPAYSKLRLPFVIVCFAVLSISAYSLSKGVSGMQTFYYESGAVQSQGEFLNGKEIGTWVYFHENGQKQLTGNFEDGKEVGLWEWYYETGELMQRGEYQNGLFDGTWLNYNAEGILVDSSNYTTGRQTGEYRAYYDNGQLSQIAQYSRDQPIGKWLSYYENGNLNSTGSFKDGELSGIWKFYYGDGTPHQEINYLAREVQRILNLWDADGKQLIEDGNGTYISYYDNKNRMEEGKVENGEKLGTWTTYYPDGKTKEVGKFAEDQYIIKTAWTEQGELMVEAGEGEFVAYYEGSIDLFEEGYFSNGLKEGKWLMYYPESGVVQQESNYKNGKLDGYYANYSSFGGVLSEGSFKSGKQTGEWNWYYENGQLSSSASFVDGQKEGEQIFWTELGIEAKKEVYENGNLVSEVLL